MSASGACPSWWACMRCGSAYGVGDLKRRWVCAQCGTVYGAGEPAQVPEDVNARIAEAKAAWQERALGEAAAFEGAAAQGAAHEATIARIDAVAARVEALAQQVEELRRYLAPCPGAWGEHRVVDGGAACLSCGARRPARATP